MQSWREGITSAEGRQSVLVLRLCAGEGRGRRAAGGGRQARRPRLTVARSAVRRRRAPRPQSAARDDPARQPLEPRQCRVVPPLTRKKLCAGPKLRRLDTGTGTAPPPGLLPPAPSFTDETRGARRSALGATDTTRTRCKRRGGGGGGGGGGAAHEALSVASNAVQQIIDSKVAPARTVARRVPRADVESLSRRAGRVGARALSPVIYDTLRQTSGKSRVRKSEVPASTSDRHRYGRGTASSS